MILFDKKNKKKCNNLIENKIKKTIWNSIPNKSYEIEIITYKKTKKDHEAKSSINPMWMMKLK